MYDLIVDAPEDLPEARAGGMRDEEIRGGVSIDTIDLRIDNVGLTPV